MRWAERREAVLPLMAEVDAAEAAAAGFVRTAALRTPALARKLLAHALTRPLNVATLKGVPEWRPAQRSGLPS